MSIINCPECNKEISDKANSCPNCGNPLQIEKSEKPKEEEYLACPKCRSKELHSDKAGFSGTKAVAGAILTGGIGLLAGTIGSNKVNITCLKCGNKFKAGEAILIKIGVSNASLDQRIINEYKKTNNRLSAVKLYQDETNCDFAESTKYVNLLLLDNIPKGSPGNPGNSGCMIMFSVLVSLGLLITYLVI